MLVAIESPIRAVAISAAGTNSTSLPPQASAMSCCRLEPGSCQSGFFTNAAVGVVVPLISARVRPALILSRASLLALTTRSQPMTSRASPVPSRATCTCSARSARRTWDMTAPYFCASPDMSSTDTPLPSRCAAMPRIWPMVMTPVPPMPVTRTPQGSASGAGVASGIDGNPAPSPAAPRLPLRSWPPSTVTKLGQKPFTQEKSLLQVDWLIVRLRPNSVSSGSTDRQLDLSLQSPQPSHTISLITARFAGSGYAPRLRRRRFSEAQV